MIKGIKMTPKTIPIPIPKMALFRSAIKPTDCSPICIRNETIIAGAPADERKQ